MHCTSCALHSVHSLVVHLHIQDIRVHNPTGKAVQLGLEKLGIAQWDTAKSFTRWGQWALGSAR